MDDLYVLSCNVWGLGDKAKRGNVYSSLIFPEKSRKPDIFMFQETRGQRNLLSGGLDPCPIIAMLENRIVRCQEVYY